MLTKRRFWIAVLQLLLVLDDCGHTSGFALPSALIVHKNFPLNRYHPLHVSAAVADPKLSLNDANMELDRLAETCGDPPPIRRAAECEAFYQDMPERDTVSLNILLKAWGKCCSALAENKRHYFATTNIDVPDEIENMAAVTTTIPVYTARDAAERATNWLLRDCHEDDRPDIVPDTTSYNAVIDAWAKSRVDDAPQAAERLLQRMIHDGLTPDSFSYNGVLDAWAYSGKPESVSKVQSIFHKMQELYESEGAIKPTIRTVNSMIHAHAKLIQSFYPAQPEDAWDLANQAHDLLRTMKKKYNETSDVDYQPDVMTYTSVMNAYARCGSYRATQRCEKLLHELQYFYDQTKTARFQPNLRTYTSLVGAWANTRSHQSPKRAEQLLQEMVQRGIEPNVRTYTLVIQAWARSRDNDKASKALQWLRQMKELAKDKPELHPNLITYNTAIDACARSSQGTAEQQTLALKIAFAIFKAMEMDPVVTPPNHVTFATLIKCAAFLLPAGEERNTVATAVFEKAKKNGMVEAVVIKNLRRAVDASVVQNLLDDLKDKNGHIDFNNIPAAWSKHVRS